MVHRIVASLAVRSGAMPTPATRPAPGMRGFSSPVWFPVAGVLRVLLVVVASLALPLPSAFGFCRTTTLVGLGFDTRATVELFPRLERSRSTANRREPPPWVMADRTVDVEVRSDPVFKRRVDV